MQPPKQKENRQEDSRKINLAVIDWTLGEFSRMLARDYAITVVLAESVESSRFSAEFVECPLATAVELAAKRAGASVLERGGAYYLGTLVRQDSTILVRRVRRIGDVDAKSLLDSMLSESGRCSVLADGLIVVADVGSVVERINQALDEVEAVPPGSWVVQVQVIGFSESAARDFGLSVTPAASVAYVASEIGAGVKSSLSVDAILSAAASRSDVVVLSSPLLSLQDGAVAEFSRTARVPYKQSRVSTSVGSSVVQEQVEFLDVGFSAVVKLREQNGDLAGVHVDISNSNYSTGDVAPEVTTEKSKVVCVCQSGVQVLAASYDGRRESRGLGGGLAWLSSAGRDVQTWQVWVRADRVR